MKLFMRKIQEKTGFTLVELMVVVAIIGILSAIAIPQFQTYQAKSKTSEAKLSLSSIYTAQTAFFSDYDIYGVCLDAMGYKPGSNTYYATGHEGNATAVAENPSCVTVSAANSSWWDQTKAVAGTTVTGANMAAGMAVTVADAVFTAGACGAIERNHVTTGCSTAANNVDSWTIDEGKAVIHQNPGY